MDTKNMLILLSTFEIVCTIVMIHGMQGKHSICILVSCRSLITFPSKLKPDNHPFALCTPHNIPLPLQPKVQAELKHMQVCGKQIEFAIYICRTNVCAQIWGDIHCIQVFVNTNSTQPNISHFTMTGLLQGRGRKRRQSKEDSSRVIISCCIMSGCHANSRLFKDWFWFSYCTDSN